MGSLSLSQTGDESMPSVSTSLQHGGASMGSLPAALQQPPPPRGAQAPQRDLEPQVLCLRCGALAWAQAARTSGAAAPAGRWAGGVVDRAAGRRKPTMAGTLSESTSPCVDPPRAATPGVACTPGAPCLWLSSKPSGGRLASSRVCWRSSASVGQPAGACMWQGQPVQPGRLPWPASIPQTRGHVVAGWLPCAPLGPAPAPGLAQAGTQSLHSRTSRTPRTRSAASLAAFLAGACVAASPGEPGLAQRSGPTQQRLLASCVCFAAAYSQASLVAAPVHACLPAMQAPGLSCGS